MSTIALPCQSTSLPSASGAHRIIGPNTVSRAPPPASGRMKATKRYRQQRHVVLCCSFPGLQNQLQPCQRDKHTDRRGGMKRTPSLFGGDFSAGGLGDVRTWQQQLGGWSPSPSAQLHEAQMVETPCLGARRAPADSLNPGRRSWGLCHPHPRSRNAVTADPSGSWLLAGM